MYVRQKEQMFFNVLEYKEFIIGCICISDIHKGGKTKDMKGIINKITRLLLVVLMLLVSFGINNTVYADDVPTLANGGTYEGPFDVGSDGAYVVSSDEDETKPKIFLSEGAYYFGVPMFQDGSGKTWFWIGVYDFNNELAGEINIGYQDDVTEDDEDYVTGIKCIEGDGSEDNPFVLKLVYGDPLTPLTDEVTVTIDVGSNHIELANKMVESLSSSGITATANGSIVTVKTVKMLVRNFISGYSEGILGIVLGGQKIHNGEEFLMVAPAQQYSSWDDFGKTMRSLGEGLLTDGQQFSMVWVKYIKEVTVISSYPEEGQKVVYDHPAGYEWPVQTPAPKMSLSDNCFVTKTPEGVELTLWYEYSDPLGDDPFKGPAFEEGKKYTAYANIKPKFGYLFPSSIQGLDVKVNEDVGEEFLAELEGQELKVHINLPTKSQSEISYNFKGNNQDYVKGSGSYTLAKIVREPNDTSFDNFFVVDGAGGDVSVDGKPVEPKYYQATKGSLVLTFTEEFMNTLALGGHTVKVTFVDGKEITGKFNVVNPSPKPKYTAPKTGVE